MALSLATQDPKRNNWILPIREDEWDAECTRILMNALDLPVPVNPQEHIEYVREMALRSTFRYERTPIWDSMKPYFYDMFMSWKYADLKAFAIRLGILTKRSHDEQAAVLIRYFNEMVGI